ncbi:hypothetical protein IVA78_28915 [Bradyrhizobium sp. 137]|uniref:hypothetical protein n=1 Tax=Bradyrhizobium sp. 137 TaxID=2782614 RepID=UPI001FFB6967|nr:hypothetical protein [Bradyrhizobium sp. 137]MCK1759075.1 hypothetical protein [Bradyrhizobium sp. 137]
MPVVKDADSGEPKAQTLELHIWAFEERAENVVLLGRSTVKNRRSRPATRFAAGRQLRAPLSTASQRDPAR